jgi:hypothetical protein
LSAKRQIVLHPFLFAVYAVLGIYSINAVEVPVQWIFRPLLILMIVVTVVLIVAQSVVGNVLRAGLITTLILFWLFLGHFHRALYEISPFWNTTLGVLLAFVIWTIPVVFLGSRWTWLHISHPVSINTFLNLTSIIVVLYPAFVAANSLFRSADTKQRLNS